MFHNLLIAIAFIVTITVFLTKFETIFKRLNSINRHLTRVAKNTKLLINYLGRAYIRYRRTIQKSYS
ncbi:hypothetical protein COY07_03730 [Candidatus Peregrinibacteria bacterium CG_4_10_14_0_2_um_filter_43_11]|nr:MAG: hypothetical protein COY07_03730 [Candidatus Peregrinibacteria bacterium CG_4_10_14_0_2_um_filter_43_11]